MSHGRGLRVVAARCLPVVSMSSSSHFHFIAVAALGCLC